jgi:hypothetical protein
VVGSIVGGLVVLAATAYFSGPTGSSATAAAHASGPLKVTITEPADGHVTGLGQDFDGELQNLQANQLVWLFSERLSTTNGTKLTRTIFADTGPCQVVNQTKWHCYDVGTGPSPSPQDLKDHPKADRGGGTYRIWVTVVNLSDASEIVERLRSHGGWLNLDSRTKEPPHIGDAFASTVATRDDV